MIGLILAVLLQTGTAPVLTTTDNAMLCEAHTKSRLQAQLNRIEASLKTIQATMASR